MAERRIIKQQVPAKVADRVPAPSSGPPNPPPAKAPAGVADRVHYPDSNGRFLPENHLQAQAVVRMRVALEAHFEGVKNVVLRGNLYLYYERGDITKNVAPDVFVVLDHDLESRAVYKLWVEGKPPDFALEVISPSSRIRNQQDKKELYARLGIKEYFLFQPDPRRGGRRLRGYRLWDGEYVEIPPMGAGDFGVEVQSETLGVSLRTEGEFIRVKNLQTGEVYPTVLEERARRKKAEQRAAERAEKLRRSEAEVAQLRAQLARLGQLGGDDQ